MCHQYIGGVIRKVCMSPKAVETRGVMKLVYDGVNMIKQLRVLMKEKINLRVFNDSRPSLESFWSSNQMAEKALRQSVVFLKQRVEGGDIE